jgi:hypothetical protein
MKTTASLSKKQLNAKQKAVKLICNASYDFCVGYYICNATLATAVAANDRYYRHRAEEVLEQQFKCKMVYFYRFCITVTNLEKHGRTRDNGHKHTHLRLGVRKLITTVFSCEEKDRALACPRSQESHKIE